MGHLPHPGQLREPLLPQGLIGEDRHRVGQVQAPGVRPHGDAYAPVVPPLSQLLGQSGGLLAEHEPAALPEPGLGVVPWGLGGRQPQVRAGVDGKEVVQAVVDAQVHHAPVVQPRPADGLLADVEAQRLHQMEAAAGGGAGAGNVAGILRDLRLNQHNIQHALHPSIGYHCSPIRKKFQLVFGRNITKFSRILLN